MLKKDFASKYFLEVNVVVIRTNPPSMINHMLPSLFLELVIFYPWKCWNRCRGVFRTREVSMMGLFGLIVFTKKSFIDFRLGSKYDSVMEEDTWKVAFLKIPKISQKIIILEYSFSKVVNFEEKCNFYFCVTPKNCLVKIIKKHCHKKVTVNFYNFGKANFLTVTAFVTFPICIMVLYKIYQRFKAHSLNELRVSFNL